MAGISPDIATGADAPPLPGTAPDPTRVHHAAARMIRCMVVTPERPIIDEPVDFIALPLGDGEVGILPGRQPLIGRLGYGELRIKTGDVVRRYFVDGGFVQVRDNTVTVLTSRAVPVAQLDLEAATREFELAVSREAVNPADRAQKDRALDRARTLRRLAARKA